ncbi:hypothetical protein [Caenibius sp. WL]|uniref:hypothetical protein n=1 Tax=Caenibius sp. WL TaxID=2872646 RepID=UPI001C994284|nr:hypothetical protein [Caenibius sp. WL]QZP06828.1 hypothetical protein K5X80_08810 [Caenibius sp. WL]
MAYIVIETRGEPIKHAVADTVSQAQFEADLRILSAYDKAAALARILDRVAFWGSIVLAVAVTAYLGVHAILGLARQGVLPW